MVFFTTDETLELTSDDVEDAHPTFANNTAGISFVLKSHAADAFADLTERSVGETLTMSVCGETLIEAVIQGRLAGSGNAQVDGLGVATWYAQRMTGDAPCS